MQFPKIDQTHSQYAWDRYKAFHRTICSRLGVEIVQFDTGEAIVRVQKTRPEPDGRKHYVDLGIHIIATRDNDTDHQLMLEDSTPVPKAWLQGCTQTLLVDLDTQQVVGVGGQHTLPYTPEYHLHNQRHNDYAASQGVPTRFIPLQGGIAWFAGAGRVPVSNRPIRIDRPAEHSPEAWQEARAYRTAAVAWMGIQGKPTKVPAWNRPSAQRVADILKYPTFGALPDTLKENLVLGGLTAGTTVTLVPFLRLAPPRPVTADAGTTMSCTLSETA